LEIVPREPGDLGEGPPPRRLSVAKSNYGAAAEKMLFYYGASITETAAPASDDDWRRTAFRRAVVGEAVELARLRTPLNRRDRPPASVFDASEKVWGRRPSKDQIRDMLDDAVRAGELVFVERTRHQAAGYYPPAADEAHGLARQVRQATRNPDSGAVRGSVSGAATPHAT
jgi:hypothetical protein